MSSLTIATLAAAPIVLASILSVEFGISVALIEIMLGVVGGNLFGLTTTPWMDFLASFASIVLTFLAGAEVDPTLLREKFKASMLIGGLSFLLPFALTIPVAFFLLGWDWRTSEIAGVALSTTSLARDRTSRARPPAHDSTVPPVDESAIAERVRVAQTILVVSVLPLDEQLWKWLQERTCPAHAVAIICPADAASADVLLLVDAGFQVFSAGAVGTTVLVLDDRVGFALPGCQLLVDPAGVAARWRRIGATHGLRIRSGSANRSTACSAWSSDRTCGSVMGRTCQSRQWWVLP
jgi:hypothetical protein